MSARAWGALAVLCLLAWPAAGQEPAGQAPVKLEYAFDRLAGVVAVYRVETEQKVEQEVRGRDLDVASPGDEAEGGRGEAVTKVIETQEHSFARGPEGSGVVKIVTRRTEVRLEQDGQTVSYDSQQPGPVPDALRPLVERVGREVTLDVTRAGVVKRVRGVPVSLRAGYARSFLEFPEEPLRPGGSWDRQERHPVGELGTMVYTFHYVLGGAEQAEDGARVRLEARILVDLEDTPRHGQVSVELGAQEGRGALVLDGDGLVRESLLETHQELIVKARAGTQTQRLWSRSKQVLVEVRRQGG